MQKQITALLLAIPLLGNAEVHTYINIPLLSSEIVPAIESDAFGFATILYDDESNILLYSYTWKLSKGSEATAAHFHAAQRGQNGDVASPPILEAFGIKPATTATEGAAQLEGSLGDSAGNADNINTGFSNFLNIITGNDNSNYATDNTSEAKSKNAGYISGTLTLNEEQEQDLLAGRWYLNFHTTRYPGGEIRGQLIENTIDATIPFYDAQSNKLQLPLVMSKPAEQDQSALAYTVALTLDPAVNGFVLQNAQDIASFFSVSESKTQSGTDTNNPSDNSTQANQGDNSSSQSAAASSSSVLPGTKSGSL